ncbi:MAG TPA: hypothetical protein VIN07_12205 [Flavipsychrobacter sp.]
MDYRTASIIIDGAKCPVCGKVFKVNQASESDISIMHDSPLPACNELKTTIARGYRSAVDGAMSVEELKSLVGKV